MWHHICTYIIHRVAGFQIWTEHTANEGGRMIRPWTHPIVYGTQVIRKIYSVPLRFYSEPLKLSSEPLKLKSVTKCFMSYLILKTNSVDYHDGVHFVAMCKFWNIAKKNFFYTSSYMLRKNVKEILLLYFLSLKQRWPLIVDCG